ncbi:MAG TPA: hypothetical protein VGO65_11970 [Pseudolysinimonas sp.]|jgi:molecular chaperone DnaK (HSP70)|nr:hypothetical protein [Schumannella sp.]HEV7743124.1 hypothetical protein [Pseudolysinimonas sp.]
MSDETLRAATINNEFLRALGELVIAGARLEQLEISTVEPAGTDSRMPLWSQRARELLDERDRFVHAASVAHDGSTIIRVTARDGSVVAGDATYIVHLAARMNRHRGAGLAMGVPLAPGFESTATGPMPISDAG